MRVTKCDKCNKTIGNRPKIRVSVPLKWNNGKDSLGQYEFHSECAEEVVTFMAQLGFLKAEG